MADNPFGAPEHALRVNASPLQRPGRDKLIRETSVLGPSIGGERSLYLSVKALKQLLEFAEASVTKRVALNRIGIHIQLWERPNGSRYETWMFLSSEPKPESGPLFGTAHNRAVVPDWR